MDFQILQLVRVLLVSFSGFLSAFLLTPFVYGFLIQNGFRKQIRLSSSAPVFSKLHKEKEGTPTGGGIVIWFSVLALAIIFFLIADVFPGWFSYLSFLNRAETYLPLGTLAAAALVGLLDDYMGVRKIGPFGGGLSVQYKLFLYLLISGIGAYWFYHRLEWHVIHIPFFGNYDIGWWYIPFFMLIISATAHSTNITDGLDGLAGGVLMFAFFALTAVAFLLGRYDLAVFSGAVVGALLAFLWFNVHPAKFFMGDTGSMALGITLGTIALLTNTVLLLPFFAFIPMMETISVIIQLTSKKLRGGKKIFHSSPIHHHFEALGWEESQITMRFWIVSAIMTILGLIIFFIDRLL
ncbi:MAG: phospho-N-acetylmuramoyl-pentapeptide-transferase [Candidatus Harrisonbacteria bacterium]|nr:phospho-N-acetylmuramoyl-pentapeptide-transferase [Candidatus Harrisonbacteria bacterium]